MSDENRAGWVNEAGGWSIAGPDVNLVGRPRLSVSAGPDGLVRVGIVANWSGEPVRVAADLTPDQWVAMRSLPIGPPDPLRAAVAAAWAEARPILDRISSNWSDDTRSDADRAITLLDGVLGRAPDDAPVASLLDGATGALRRIAAALVATPEEAADLTPDQIAGRVLGVIHRGDFLNSDLQALRSSVGKALGLPAGDDGDHADGLADADLVARVEALGKDRDRVQVERDEARAHGERLAKHHEDMLRITGEACDALAVHGEGRPRFQLPHMARAMRNRAEKAERELNAALAQAEARRLETVEAHAAVARAVARAGEMHTEAVVQGQRADAEKQLADAYRRERDAAQSALADRLLPALKAEAPGISPWPDPDPRQALRRELFVAALTGCGQQGHPSLPTNEQAPHMVELALAVANAGASVWAAHRMPAVEASPGQSADDHDACCPCVACDEAWREAAKEADAHGPKGPPTAQAGTVASGAGPLLPREAWQADDRAAKPEGKAEPPRDAVPPWEWLGAAAGFKRALSQAELVLKRLPEGERQGSALSVATRALVSMLTREVERSAGNAPPAAAPPTRSDEAALLELVDRAAGACAGLRGEVLARDFDEATQQIVEARSFLDQAERALEPFREAWHAMSLPAAPPTAVGPRDPLEAVRAHLLEAQAEMALGPHGDQQAAWASVRRAIRIADRGIVERAPLACSPTIAAEIERTLHLVLAANTALVAVRGDDAVEGKAHLSCATRALCGLVELTRGPKEAPGAQ